MKESQAFSRLRQNKQITFCIQVAFWLLVRAPSFNKSTPVLPSDFKAAIVKTHRKTLEIQNVEKTLPALYPNSEKSILWPKQGFSFTALCKRSQTSVIWWNGNVFYGENALNKEHEDKNYLN